MHNIMCDATFECWPAQSRPQAGCKTSQNGKYYSGTLWTLFTPMEYSSYNIVFDSISYSGRETGNNVLDLINFTSLQANYTNCRLNLSMIISLFSIDVPAIHVICTTFSLKKRTASVCFSQGSCL